MLVVPAYLVDNHISSIEDASNELQAVIIDFGQAVDLRHPEAKSLLFRDLTRIRTFFVKQGVKTLNIDEATEFVTDENGEDSEERSTSCDTRSMAANPSAAEELQY